MKNTLFSVLITLLVLPAFAPLLPHGAVHALHDHQESHHQSRQQADQGHGHDHATHDHDSQTQASDHHPINLDVVTYFSEYLHVDLQSPDHVVLAAPAQDTQAIDFTVANDLLLQRFELASVQNRGPPPDYGWRQFPSDTPLYLSTQRLRI